MREQRFTYWVFGLSIQRGIKIVNEINDHFLFKMDIKNKKLSK